MRESCSPLAALAQAEAVKGLARPARSSPSRGYCPQFPMGRDRFDFLVVSPLGTRYDLEVDGRHHRTPEQIHADQVRDKRAATAGYDVIRVSARDLVGKPDRVQERIARLV